MCCVLLKLGNIYIVCVVCAKLALLSLSVFGKALTRCRIVICVFRLVLFFFEIVLLIPAKFLSHCRFRWKCPIRHTVSTRRKRSDQRKEDGQAFQSEEIRSDTFLIQRIILECV